jgi:hypothetical protein
VQRGRGIRAMEKLSYLATFISLIYGLGVANLLAHLASLIKRGRDADWYWIHTLWCIYLLLLMASMWWTLQSWDEVPHIGYLSYLSLLLSPSILFIASDVLFPERSQQGNVDLRTHFLAIKNRLFLLMIALAIADELDSLLKGWQHVLELGPVYWVTQVYWYVLSIIGIRTRSERTLGVLACLALLALVASISQLAIGQ